MRTPLTSRLRCRAFTLAELLVVMAIVAILATISVISIGSIAKEARVSSAKNAVVAALEQARGYAMRHNTLVMVTFRVKFDPSSAERQFTQVWVSEFAGSDRVGSGGGFVLDRFVPIEDFAVRDLPAGIKVAGPYYDRSTGGDRDHQWITQPEFRAIAFENEAATAGRYFGILYGPTGDLRTQTSETGASNIWVDYDPFDGAGAFGQQLDHAAEVDLGGYDDASNFWYYDHWDDEPNVNPVPFISVYDDDAARERKTGPWTSENTYLNGLGGLITQYSDRIHFNRYSGVVLR